MNTENNAKIVSGWPTEILFENENQENVVLLEGNNQIVAKRVSEATAANLLDREDDNKRPGPLSELFSFCKKDASDEIEIDEDADRYKRPGPLSELFSLLSRDSGIDIEKNIPGPSLLNKLLKAEKR